MRTTFNGLALVAGLLVLAVAAAIVAVARSADPSGEEIHVELSDGLTRLIERGVHEAGDHFNGIRAHVMRRSNGIVVHAVKDVGAMADASDVRLVTGRVARRQWMSITVFPNNQFSEEHRALAVFEGLVRAVQAFVPNWGSEQGHNSHEGDDGYATRRWRAHLIDKRQGKRLTVSATRIRLWKNTPYKTEYRILIWAPQSGAVPTEKLDPGVDHSRSTEPNARMSPVPTENPNATPIQPEHRR